MGEGEDKESLGQDGCEIRVSHFDYSVENHFKAMDIISKLCGEVDIDSLEGAEIQRLSSSVTFLREWRHYNYEPRTVRFACDPDNSQQNSFLGEINLPQFSSAAVPKECIPGGIASPESSKDFVMYVGGSVWALDWCPRPHEKPSGHVKCEFVAVAAHPPDSYYHKIGALLTGRGVVQIWCILHVSGNEKVAPSPMKKSKWKTECDNDDKLTLIKRPKGRPRKKQVEESSCGEIMKNSNEFKRPRGRPRKKKQIEEFTNDGAKQYRKPRGRPRKKVINESLDNLDCDNQYIQVLAVQYPEDSTQMLDLEGVSGNGQEETAQKKKGKKQKTSISLSTSTSDPENIAQSRKLKSKAKASGKRAAIICPPLLTQNENQSSIINHQIDENCLLDNVPCDINSDSCFIPKNVILPRVVLCLAHNGKVVWDLKWRPCHVSDPKCLHQMGYLAVLLGSGSLEVWDVPLPHITKAIYTSSHKEGTDPRFMKLEPVFKCSLAKCGEIQSIPLTVEWSTSCPHDYLLAGCHDGTVALWKFSAYGTSGDTRPLLCFSADTVPIRAVAWAPAESDQESANVILTAGHGALKFWDIRDPFRPLWELHPAPKFIYSVDWVPDPRCIILSLDDGTMRLLSLVKAAYDAHVNGKPSVGPKQQGMHVLNCSSFAIWSVQVSRKTGMVAYCSADGSVYRFQLTAKAVEKDASRNRAPHFKIGSLSKDGSALIVNTSFPYSPLSSKKPVNNVGEYPRTMRSLFESSQTKRANDNKAKAPAADDPPLAICYGNDPTTQSGLDETLATLKEQTKSKYKNTTSKTMAGEDLALVCVNEAQRSTLEKASMNDEIKVIPPKIVGMHRVRWNMNRGSEKWLCSGGAAGIVRCQEILLSDKDKDLARKR